MTGKGTCMGIMSGVLSRFGFYLCGSARVCGHAFVCNIWLTIEKKSKENQQHLQVFAKN